MLNQLNACVYQVVRSAAFRSAMAACAVAGAVYVLLSHLIATGSVSSQVGASAQSVSDVILIPLFGALLAGIVVGSDFEIRTIHDHLLSTSRLNIVASRMIVVVLGVMAFFLPYGIAAGLGLRLSSKFSSLLPTLPINIVTNPTHAPVNAHTFGVVALLTIVQGLIFAAEVAPCVPFAFWVRKPIAVTAFGLLGTFLAQSVASFLVSRSATKALAQATPWGFTSLGLDSSAATMGKGIAVALSWILIFGVWAWLVFRRSDVK